MRQGWKFPIEFTEGINPTRLVSEDEDIRQCLMILLSTRPGERIHRYDYGFSLGDIAFEEDTLEMKVYIEKTIIRLIEKHEPRIEVNNIFINADAPEKGNWEIRIVYTILNNDTQDILKYTVKI